MISRFLLIVAVCCFGYSIYYVDGQLHKRLVILGFLLFAIFEGIRKKGD